MSTYNQQTNLTVADILAKKGSQVYSVRQHETIADAVNLLYTHRIGALLVKDGAAGIRGILSERDIVRKLAQTPGKTLLQQVKDLMTRNVMTCRPEDSVLDVMETMTKHRFRHAPVIGPDGLCGMVTLGDLISARLTELQKQVEMA